MKKMGRKSRYGETTVPMRIPVSMVPEVEKLLERRGVVTEQVYEVVQYPPAVQSIIDRVSSLYSAPMVAMIDVLRENGFSDERLALVEKELCHDQAQIKALASACVGASIDEAEELGIEATKTRHGENRSI